MSTPESKARAILGNADATESTGKLKGRTPILSRVGLAIAALTLLPLANCAPGSMGGQPNFGAYGSQQGILTGPSNTIGTIAGGVGGGLLGRSLGGRDNRGTRTVVGGLAGALIGNLLSRGADAQPQYQPGGQFQQGGAFHQGGGFDPRYQQQGMVPLSQHGHQAMLQAENQVLRMRPGTRTAWRDDATGAEGFFVKTREGQMPNGQFCAEVIGEAVIGGQHRRSSGLACDHRDGRGLRFINASLDGERYDRMFASVTEAMPGWEIASAEPEQPTGPRAA